MSSDPSAPLLQIDDLHVQFGTGAQPARAVDGVSLTVERGEVLALVGESGCGKTTLIRTVMGLQQRTNGTIRVLGDPVEGRGSKASRRRVQMVFQDPTGALNPRHTVFEAVYEGVQIHKLSGDPSARVATALANAGLRPAERFMPRYPHEISGGQRQRVLIAGAMALEPQLLLADEPVASLDASIRGEILALLRQLVDNSGVGIVAVTHDLGLAWNIADRVAVMYLGRIVELGPTEQVLGNPQHPYTKALLSVVPESAHMDQQILRGETPNPKRIPPGCRFHPRCPLLASGTLSPAMEARCRGEDPVLVEHAVGGPSHQAACHATAP